MTDQYYILGTDVSKSPSPAMFNSAFSVMHIDAVYGALNIPADRFVTEFTKLKDSPVKGMNITIPFKTQVLPFLDELDSTSTLVGAVNVVVNSDKKFVGYNTDVYGIIDSLKTNGVNSVHKSLLLGAGGAARAFCAAMNQLKCKEISVLVRNEHRARSFIDSMRNSFPSIKITLHCGDLPPEERYDIIFNATPPMSLNEAILTEIGRVLSRDTTVFDAVYNPPYTNLILLASESGAKTILGTEMLLNQAVHGFKIWTGMEPPRTVMANTLRTIFGVVCT